MAHAYIFAGPRGTGKTSIAQHPRQGPQLRQADGTGDRATPCGECDPACAIAEGTRST